MRVPNVRHLSFVMLALSSCVFVRVRNETPMAVATAELGSIETADLSPGDASSWTWRFAIEEGAFGTIAFADGTAVQIRGCPGALNWYGPTRHWFGAYEIAITEITRPDGSMDVVTMVRD